VRRRAALLLGLALGLAPAAAFAESLVTTISSNVVRITSTYTGAELVVFGVIERDGREGARNQGYDVVVTAKGPEGSTVVREKVRFGPIWMNLNQRKFIEVPTTLAVLSNRVLDDIAEPHLRRRYRLGLDMNVGTGGTDVAWDAAFRDALIRLKRESGLYMEDPKGVAFLSSSIFRATVPVPATAPVGPYRVEISLLSSGVELTRSETAFEVSKVGFEQAMVQQARDHGWFYGLFTAAIALAFGYMATIIFRRD
jgi:uncharacterized protein (TIGR02186 family)